MEFIRFENARDKEEARQKLREARAEMLEKMQQQSERRAKIDVERKLKGDADWMLPSVSKKIDKLSAKLKSSSAAKNKKTKSKDKCKKKVKKSSRDKKSSKKKHKKHNTSSSSDATSESDNESDSDSSASSGSNSSTDKDKEKTRKRKSSKKSKKSKKRHHKSSSSDSDSDSDSDEEAKKDRLSKKSKSSKSKAKKRHSSSAEDEEKWVECPPPKTAQQQPSSLLQRDTWMTDDSTLSLKTFARERVEKKPNEKQQIDSYDPAKSTRELNPYWKLTGTGLPGAFKKPKENSDDEYETTTKMNAKRYEREDHSQNNSARSWQKQKPPDLRESNHRNDARDESRQNKRRTPPPPTRSSPSSSSQSSTSSEGEAEAEAEERKPKIAEFLTDQQMNELGAKILKAEILGNMELAEELKKKLENARINRTAIKEQANKRQEAVRDKKRQAPRRDTEEGEEHILLTRTDQQGNYRPLVQAAKKPVFDPRDLYGGRRSGQKKPTKRAETHEGGERVRYFPDDDKYDIKQMFEREKYSTAADSNLEFANIASKHKNPNDDLDDIFTDKVRKNIPESETDKREMQRAIAEHQKLTTKLDNCDKCFESSKMDKQLLLSLGDKAYLSLPWHIGLQAGHCLIVPTQHVSCCTQLDEDAWEEINNFRKAITRMFAAQKKDVIFFEIANKLHRRPHLSIQCVPIPETEGESAPFYFKKAIEESEHEWSVNKQLVSLRQKSLRSCIPKGLPYFWVNFGMDSGFAHVIEDENRFPSNFALEIIGGMLHLDARKWRKPQKEQNVIQKVQLFANWWKRYDFTS